MLLADGRVWLGIAIGVAAVYAWNYWQRKNGRAKG